MSVLFTKLNYCWRWCGTAFGFALFGAGCVLLPLITIPVLYLLPGSTGKRQRRAKLTVHFAFRAYINILKYLGVLEYQVTGVSHLNRPGTLILANHPSLIDVIFLIAFTRHADCIVKSALLTNIFTRWPILTAGYIANDSPEGVINAAKESLDKGNNLIIFPEGTRTTPGQPLALQRGAANIATRINKDITPVIITCSPTTLTKKDKWYQVPKSKIMFTIKVNKQLSVAEYSKLKPSIGARKLTEFLGQYYNEELQSL